jgi:hypothetical protein
MIHPFLQEKKELFELNFIIYEPSTGTYKIADFGISTLSNKKERKDLLSGI